MRPRPSETIDGIRKILADTIAPELTSEHARARLSEIRAVLAAVDWDNSGFTLVSQSSALAAALESSARRANVAVPPPPTVDTFEDWEAYHNQLAVLAVDAMADIRARLAENPDDDLLTTELQEILLCL